MIVRETSTSYSGESFHRSQGQGISTSQRTNNTLHPFILPNLLASQLEQAKVREDLVTLQNLFTDDSLLTKTRPWLQVPKQRLPPVGFPARCRKSRLHQLPIPPWLQPMPDQSNHQSQAKSSTSDYPEINSLASLMSRPFAKQPSRKSHLCQHLQLLPLMNQRHPRPLKQSLTIQRHRMRADPHRHRSKTSSKRVYRPQRPA